MRGFSPVMSSVTKSIPQTVTQTLTGGVTCLPSATYASLAAAESSGDTWCDGAEITITAGAVFKYFDVLAVSGYSGLIHKELYGAGNGTIVTPTLLASHPANTDPDLWGWSDIGSGTKAVDYEYDTNGGRARLRDLTTAGKAFLHANQSSVLSKETFAVTDDVQVPLFTATAFESAALQTNSQKADEVDYVLNTVRVANSLSSTKWVVNHGAGGASNTVTTKPFGTASRIWMYLKEGRLTVWFDADSTPEVNVTDPRALTAAIAGNLLVSAGSTGAGPSTMELGRQVFGRMTTA